jgi:hypothetical protein
MRAIWLALAVGAFLGGLRAVLGRIDTPPPDADGVRPLIAETSRFGLAYGAIIFAVVQGWTLAVAAGGG